MDWHILKELWKESPAEEGRVEIAAQWSLCLVQLSVGSNLHVWISQTIFKGNRPDLQMCWHDKIFGTTLVRCLLPASGRRTQDELPRDI